MNLIHFHFSAFPEKYTIVLLTIEIHLTHRERGQIQHVPRVTVQEHVHSKRASVMTCLLHAYATLKK